MTSVYVRGLILGVALSLASAAVGVARDDDGEIKKAQKVIIDLAKTAEGGKDISKEAESIRKKFEELNTLMHAYKPSTKKGIGVGKAGPGDGIESKILALSKRAPSAMALKNESADLVKIGYINVALAEITKHYAPAKPKGGKGKKEWVGYSEDMKKASEALIKAAKGSDPAAVKKAAGDLLNSCNSCHSDFRDS